MGGILRLAAHDFMVRRPGGMSCSYDAHLTPLLVS